MAKILSSSDSSPRFYSTLSMTRLFARLAFYPTLAWNLLLSRVLKLRRWWDRIDDFVILGALPFPSLVDEMVAERVGAVVNTCEEYAGPEKKYQAAGIVQLRVPTVDFTSPSLESIEHAVAFINKHVSQGETVYVHCKAGRARSATVLLCWLIDAKGLTAEQAQRLLLEKRPHVNPSLVQRDVVATFIRRRR